MVKFLVEQCGVNPHYDNDNAVKYASDFGNFDIVKYLVLSHGAPTTHIRPEYKDVLEGRQTTLSKMAVKQWRTKMEEDESDVTTPFGKWMMEKNYGNYLKLLKHHKKLLEQYLDKNGQVNI